MILFGQAEIKINQSNHGAFRSFDINQSESSFTLRKFLSFLTSPNHNQSFTQNGVSNVFDIKQPSIPSHVLFVRLTNQNEVFKDFKNFFRSQQNYVYETSQPITFTKFF